MILNDWEIGRRADACTITQQPFAEGEYFFTAIYREKSAFRREDISESAWKELPPEPRPFSFWRSKFELPPPPPPEPLAKQDAESILRRLIAENDDSTHNARYILAAMLERKRILKPMPNEDSDVIVYEHSKAGETFIIRDPHLSLDQIPAVQLEVSALLGDSPV